MSITYVGKILVNGKLMPVGSSLFGICESEADEATKSVELPNFDTLMNGITVHVKFTNTNSAENPRLNVNDTGTFNIYMYDGKAVGTTPETSWRDGAIVSLTYDGTGWVLNDAANTLYEAAIEDPEDISSDFANIGESDRYAREDHVHKILVESGDENGQVKIAGTNASVTGLNQYAFRDSLTKEDVGLPNVENKSSADIRSELTRDDIEDALGYVPTNEVVTVLANGLAPKLPNDGQTTKYLRQDGTWAVPPDTDTTYEAATNAPLMDREAVVGVSSKYAREDHIHPSDTSRVSVTTKINGHSLSSDVTLTPSDIGAINVDQIGVPGGITPLNSEGQIDSTYLPSFVDDVLEFASVSSFPEEGESGKIYVALDSNLTYRWSGSTYIEISKSLAIGTTSNTAFRGDYGEIAYEHATESGKVGEAIQSGFYKVAATSEGHIAGLTPVTKSDVTGLGIPAEDTNTTYEFENGTNGFTVNDTEGNSQFVKVTPKIQNNIIGVGEPGYLAEFGGANVITLGPQFGDNRTTFLRNDGTWAAPIGTTYATVSKDGPGLAPQLPNESTTAKYLRQDGTWAVPPDTTYSDVSIYGSGLAPQLPNDGETTKYLRQDGSWWVPPDTNTTYDVVSKSAPGLTPQLPNETDTTKYLRQDGTWEVPPDTNTTYDVVSKTAPGLVPQLPDEDVVSKFLRQDGTWAVPFEGAGELSISTDTIGSASAGAPISADDITSWSPGTLPTLTFSENTVKSVDEFSAGSLPNLTHSEKTIGSASNWSAGTLPNLEYETSTVKTVSTWSAGSMPSLTHSSKTVGSVSNWSAGSLPNLTHSEKTVGSASNWSAGTMTSATLVDGVLEITVGTAPSLTVTQTAIDSVDTWSAGSLPSATVSSVSIDSIDSYTEGTAPSLTTANTHVDSISTWSAGTAPSLTVSNESVSEITAWSRGTLPSLTTENVASHSIDSWAAGTLPNLSYTDRTIPNITVTEKTVVTDVEVIDTSNSSGGT